MNSLLLFLLPIILCTGVADARVGINYGLLGSNLPSPEKVVALYNSRNVHRLRLFNPNATVLRSLMSSQIEVILGTLNEDLPLLGSNQSFANDWVRTNIVPYASALTFRYINAGNEVIPGPTASNVLPAMQNLASALAANNLNIPVTTAVSTSVLGASYPPSQGSFSESSAPTIAPILAYLESKKTPLMVNVYPYFAYAADSANVRLDYALFTANDAVVQDGGLSYNNMFDAIVDSVYAAMEKSGGSGVEVVVSETGWPSGGGGVGASVENARAYNNGVVVHVEGGEGTPRRPGKEVETYLFAMFNEDLKPEGTERNFGLYQPDMSEVYHVNFAS